MITKDLVALVADLDAEYALRGLFSRPKALGTREFTFDIFRHPRRDPGCLLESVDFLRALLGQYTCALVVFDHEGSGRERVDNIQIQEELSGELQRSGWPRSLTLVLHPELEIWVWSDSPQVDATLGWQGKQPPLREWLRARNWLKNNEMKPNRPKEAMRESLRQVRKAPSASLFLELASSVSFKRCQDREFRHLVAQLADWFPQT